MRSVCGVAGDGDLHLVFASGERIAQGCCGMWLERFT